LFLKHGHSPACSRPRRLSMAVERHGGGAQPPQRSKRGGGEARSPSRRAGAFKDTLADDIDSVFSIFSHIAWTFSSKLSKSRTGDRPQAIHNYFAYRLHESRRRLRLFFRDGRVALLIGVVFLFACIVLREFIFAVGSGATADIASEGLLIVGWVAMWRPLEIFLYDWRPIRRRCQVFAKLSEMPVIVRAA